MMIAFSGKSPINNEKGGSIPSPFFAVTIALELRSWKPVITQIKIVTVVKERRLSLTQ